MSKETIYETYTRTVCSNCKNRKLNLCNIRKNIKGNLKCVYYEKDKEMAGYKRFKGVTAKQNKPIMRQLV